MVLSLNGYGARRAKGAVAADTGVESHRKTPTLTHPAELVARHRVRLDNLRLEGGYSTTQFQELVESTLLRVADYVHLLPASESQHHSEPGGLLRLAIESGCFAYRRGDGKFLAGPPVTEAGARERERAWRFAGFLAGVARPLAGCLTRIKVVSATGEAWKAGLEGLWPWLQRQNGGAVEVKWRSKPNESGDAPASVWIAARVLPDSVYAYLGHGGDELLDCFAEIVCGSSKARVAPIVAEAIQDAIQIDAIRRGPARTTEPFGRLLDDQILEALVGLARDVWTCNLAGSRIWVAERGVFLQWQPAFVELSQRLQASGILGAPATPDVMAEYLLSRKLLRGGAGSYGPSLLYQKIVPVVRGAPRQVIEVVQLEDTQRLGLKLENIAWVELDKTEGGARTDSSGRESPQAKTPFSLVPPPTAAMTPSKGKPGSGRGGALSRANSGVGVVDSSKSEAIARASAGGAVTDTGRDRDASGSVEEVRTGTQTAHGTGMGQPEASGKSQSSEAQERLERLAQFGPVVGSALRVLSDRMAEGALPAGACIVLSEGIALEFPGGISLLGQEPQEFLSSAQMQGLLVGSKSPGGGFVHERGPGTSQPEVPSRYVVLSTRVSRYLPQQRSG